MAVKNKKSPMKKKFLKGITVHKFGSFPAEMLVCVGVTKKEVEAYCKDKKQNITKEYKEWLTGNSAEIEGAFAQKEGGSFAYNGDKRVLVINKFEDTWNSWQTLMHEIHHAVAHVAMKHKFEDESEAQAYTFEQAFREIRRKLQGIDPI